MLLMEGSLLLHLLLDNACNPPESLYSITREICPRSCMAHCLSLKHNKNQTIDVVIPANSPKINLGCKMQQISKTVSQYN